MQSQDAPSSTSKVRFHPPTASSSTSFLADISDSDTLSSSDEDDRVFFGSRRAGEDELVAKLSKGVSATPRARVKKRDSREFLRRKTILASPAEVPESSRAGDCQIEEELEGQLADTEGTPIKVWPGGFHERRDAGADDSDLDSPTPSSSSSSHHRPIQWATPGRTIEEDHCDLTLDFSRFRVSDSPLSNRRSPTRPAPRSSMLAGSSTQAEDVKSEVETSESEGDEEEWSDSVGEDSDKENAPVPLDEGVALDDEERVEYPLFDGPVTGGKHLVEDDVLRELNLGGLRLGDFADPQLDFSHIMAAATYSDDLGYSSPEEEGHVDLSEDADIGYPTAPMVLGEIDPNLLYPAEATPALDEITSPEKAMPNPSASASPPSPTPSSASFDSPLPLARGGPVVIPPSLAYYSPMTADSTSRSSPFSADHMHENATPPSLAMEPATALRLLASSMRLSPTRAHSSSREGSIGASTPTAKSLAPANTQLATKQPLRSSSLTVSGSSILSLPPPLPLPVLTSNRELPEDAAARRSEAIKKNLASVFSGKTLGLGASHRSASSSSSQSSSTSSGRPGSRLGDRKEAEGKLGRKQAHTGMAARGNVPPPPAVSTSAIPTSTLSTSTSSSSSHRPVSAMGFVRRPPTVPVAPRPALAARPIPPAQPTHGCRLASRVPPAKTARTVVAGTTKSKASLSASSSAPARPQNAPFSRLTSRPLQDASPNSRVPPRASANPLKRPLPVTQPIAASRMTLSAGSGTIRPTLGLPSRVVGDQVFTLSSSRMAAVPEGSPSVSGGFSQGPEVGPGPMFSLGLGDGRADIGGVRFASPERTSTRLLIGGGAVRGTPMSVRASKFGTPSRSKFGTPSRSLGTPSRLLHRARGPAIQVFSTGAGPAAPKDVGMVPPAPTGPPSQNLRHTEPSTSTGGQVSSGHRGSSEDHEDVSFALPTLAGGSSELGSSPVKTPKDDHDHSTEDGLSIVDSPALNTRVHGRDVHPSKLAAMTSSTSPLVSPTSTRPKRTIKPPAPLRTITQPKVTSNPATTLSIAPNLSEKELKAKTTHNTAKNEKYACAIDRQVVRVCTVRPPSPTSKIPTTEQREEEAKKRDREVRAKRRKGKGADGEDEVEEEEEMLPIIRRLEGVEVDWKGDEEGWDREADARPAKRAKLTGKGALESRAEKEKWVKWDKGLVIIRDDGGPYLRGEGQAVKMAAKSALKRSKQVPLDQYGNVLPSRPKEPVKPQKVVVAIRVFEGEEPVLPISQATRGKKKGASG